MRLFWVAWWTIAFAVVSLAADGPARRAPGFALMDQNGQFHDLGDHLGKVVLLDIMQTRCPNCQKLSQTLEAIHAQYGDKVAIVSVVNPPDNRQSVVAYIKQFRLTTPVLFDCGQMAASYIRPDPARPRVHLPHLFLLKRNDFQDIRKTRENAWRGVQTKRQSRIYEIFAFPMHS